MATSYTIKANEAYKSNEVYFEGKPEQETINAMKALGLRWNRAKLCWYGFASAEEISAAIEAKASPAPVKKATKARASLWERCDFSTIPEHCRTLDTKTIAKETREHLKERFPECRFSVRIGSGSWSACNEVNAYITASPYEKPENIYSNRYHYDDKKRSEREPLQAILDYCQAWLQSYNYDNSDLMTDYFDVNFYGDFKIAYDYKQTEATPAIIADLENYAERRVEVKKAEDEAERIAYEAYLKERDEEAKRAEVYRIECERKTKAIEAGAVVVDIPEAEQIKYEGLRGGCGKEATLDEVREVIAEEERKPQTAKVSRKVFLNAELYKNFCGMLLHDFTFLAGKGGTATDDERVTEDNFARLNEEQRESVEFYMSDCVAIYENNVLRLIIDPEGYNYARYTYIVTDETRPAPADVMPATKPAFYFPAPIAEQTKALEVGDVVTVLCVDPWTMCAEHVSGMLSSVTIADYAQYKDAATLLIRQGKKAITTRITNATDAAIFRDILPDVPRAIREADAGHNMKYLRFAGADAKQYLIDCIEYYKAEGFECVADTIQR